MVQNGRKALVVGISDKVDKVKRVGLGEKRTLPRLKNTLKIERNALYEARFNVGMGNPLSSTGNPTLTNTLSNTITPSNPFPTTEASSNILHRLSTIPFFLYFHQTRSYNKWRRLVQRQNRLKTVK